MLSSNFGGVSEIKADLVKTEERLKQGTETFLELKDAIKELKESKLSKAEVKIWARAIKLGYILGGTAGVAGLAKFFGAF